MLNRLNLGIIQNQIHGKFLQMLRERHRAPQTSSYTILGSYLTWILPSSFAPHTGLGVGITITIPYIAGMPKGETDIILVK